MKKKINVIGVGCGVENINLGTFDNTKDALDFMNRICDKFGQLEKDGNYYLVLIEDEDDSEL